MKKTPKKFYIKKTVKVRKDKQAKPRVTGKRLKLPSIFRIIPAQANQTISHLDRFALISFASGALLVLFLIGLYDYQLDKSRLAMAQGKKEELLKQRNYWQQVVGDHKGYRDGYYMLAVSEFRLNNKNEARVNIEKALELDPLFEQGKRFKEKLQEK
ncbi:MAG: hypothetical protein HYT11_02110 [Candidatus Levybacteria bacterium]|nr:hypothetical protein [Candidatus Levybacteria bacterium]